ncbi:MAG: hypothetical protein LUC94_01920, partial [Clostridiales bacterium]|nr:hypothetical protein [Clostridiales bacterium]
MEYTINEISILEDYEVTRDYDFDDEDGVNDGSDPNRIGNLGNRVYVDAGPGSASGNQGSGLASDDEDGKLVDDSEETFDSVYGLTTTNRDEIEALIAEEYKNSGLLSYNLTCRSMGLLSGLTYVITFDAEEGYIFSIDTEKLRLDGLGATYLKHEREDSRKKLILYVRFDELDSLAWEIENPGWSSEEVGIAEWGDSVSGSPAWYELRLERGTSRAAEGKITGATAYDFRPYMLTEGEYAYSIRPVSDSGEKGDWRTSTSCRVSVEQAAENRARFGLETEEVFDGDGPPVETIYHNVGWTQSEEGQWWYHEPDGGYVQQNWQESEDGWYFFDGNGWLVTDSYVKWGARTFYVDSQGRMITGGKAPDGRQVQEDGSLKWPDPA